ncbi:hypothetical protein [uncultured Arcobacter sp.]|uniref:hypothetical protein n=1 Tax=uncultured Arcobacter sp. TaxID=165434 RepID=UPI0026256554|nr:hypothetical protein [uncultured Arcobacter sp.]
MSSKRHCDVCDAIINDGDASYTIIINKGEYECKTDDVCVSCIKKIQDIGVKLDLQSKFSIKDGRGLR